MILIADSGSSKTDWIVSDYRNVILRHTTKGLNPYFVDTMEISKTISIELMDKLSGLDIVSVHFYGAGCTPQKCHIVREALLQHFDGHIEVSSDMLGAARGLCGNSSGIVGILGTGANSCLYDGKAIVSNISPLGYILGDEGSGAVIGRLFLGALLKNQLFPGLKEHFLDTYQLSVGEIIEKVYRGAEPNRFLASFAPFIRSHTDRSEVYALVSEAFCTFIRRNIAQYTDYTKVPVHFTGSIAYYFKDILEESCTQEGIRIGQVLKSPAEGLIRYHSQP